MSLSVNEVSVTFGTHRALASVTFDVPHACLIGVIGPNGAGKSTLLRAIAGIAPYDGSIGIDGRPLRDLSVETAARTVAYCSQTSTPAWPITVRDVVYLGRLPHRHRSDLRVHDDKVVDQALERMVLTDLCERSITQLSGGERPRALIARTLATEARVVLVDEPTSDLDPYHELRTMEILRDESRRGVFVVAVLHNLTLAARYCDILVVIDKGTVRATGEPQVVLDETLLRNVYGVDAIIETHEHSPLVVPWRRHDGAN